MSESTQVSFASFYRATVAPLRRHLAGMLGDPGEAQDLAHDAYARVYRAMDTQRVERPRAFLFTTAHRLAISLIRRRRATPVCEGGGEIIELSVSGAPSVERLVMAREEWARFEEAIANLPPGCRRVLLSCHDENLSHAEAGAKLGIAVSTVEKQHARALRLLRAALHEDGAVRRDEKRDGCRRAGR